MFRFIREIKERHERERAEFEAKFSHLKSLIEIGETFEYLGKAMLVVRHFDQYPEFPPYPGLVCEYVGDSGSIERHWMPYTIAVKVLGATLEYLEGEDVEVVEGGEE